MRIAGVRLETVRWPIASTGAARGRTERAAVLLTLLSADGNLAYGEAAPLPGLSPDTLDDAAIDLAVFAARIPLEVEPTLAAAAALATTALSPSARFAIETALVHAAAQHRGCTVADVLADGLPHQPSD